MIFIIIYIYNYIDSTPWKANIGMALQAIKSCIFIQF